MSGTFTISGMSAGENAGERIFGPLTIQGAQVIGETLVVPLVLGDNVFAVPTEAVACAIIPPTNNEVPLTLRTNLNAADAGLPLNPASEPFVYPFGGVFPSSLIIHASAPTSSGLTIAFI